ncbi:MAG: SCO family protein [Gammaproteobacteria bacterium]|nr:SCO family protein [Gammaproteobacteria bacterium]
MTANNKALGYILILSSLLFTGSITAADQHDMSAADHGQNDHAAMHDHAKSADYDEKAALALSQAAMGQVLGDYEFLDGNGKRITLASMRGKPVIISLIYTSCYHVCPTITTNLARIVEIARAALGDDSFSVLTIGFDTPVDTPDKMRLFAKQRGIDHNNWHFVSASADTMQRLARDVGFSYFSTPKGFDHMIQATLVDADGKVYRQVYGMAPEPPALVEPLKEILYGKQVSASPLDGWINNIKLFCTVYDPSTGRYHFDYSIFIALGLAVLMLGGTAWFIISAWRKSPPSGPAT